VVRGIREGAPQQFVLQPGTWSPFNSQNTSLLREVIPAYFLSPCIGRYDDIWSSYIVTRIAQHLGDVICYGHPLVRQKRNVHDYWKDLEAERVGMVLTDEFCATLRSIPLHGATYSECFGEVTERLASAWSPSQKWSDAMRQAREDLLEGMAIWHGSFRKAIAPQESKDQERLADISNLARIEAS